MPRRVAPSEQWVLSLDPSSYAAFPAELGRLQRSNKQKMLKTTWTRFAFTLFCWLAKIRGSILERYGGQAQY